jgi:uncharacterized membrane protein YfhO
MPFVGWNLGAGLVSMLILINAYFKKPILRPIYIYWLCLIILAMLYAGGIEPLSYLARHLPIFSQNRWWFLGLDYSVFGLIVLAITWTQDSFGKEPIKLFNSLLVYFPLVSLALVYIGIPWHEYAIIIGVLAAMSIDYFTCNRNRQIVLLLFCVVFEISMTLESWPNGNTYGTSYLKDTNYTEQIKQRKISPVVLNENDRKISANQFYSVDSERWYLDKIPVSGGYDNLGSPIYWYIKNTSVNSHFFSIATKTRNEKVIDRANYKNDNNYVDAIVADILLNPSIPTSNQSDLGLSSNSGKEDILGIEIRPNKSIISVKTTVDSVVIFNNNYVPGWEAYLDGKRVPLIKINYIFMGAKVPYSGMHTVEFIFKPIILISLFGFLYITLAFLSMLYLVRSNSLQRYWFTIHKISTCIFSRSVQKN